MPSVDRGRGTVVDAVLVLVDVVGASLVTVELDAAALERRAGALVPHATSPTTATAARTRLIGTTPEAEGTARPPANSPHLTAYTRSSVASSQRAGDDQFKRGATSEAKASNWSRSSARVRLRKRT